MKVLVTGGTGFAGSHLVSLLAARGHEVLATSRHADRPGRQVALLDLPDEARSLEILSEFRPDAVVHLAAVTFVPEAEAAPEKAARVNVEGTSTLLKALRLADPEGRVRFIHASSAQVYAAGGTLPVREEARVLPETSYGRTKLAGELVARAYARADARTAVIFRPFNHVGPGQKETFAVSGFARRVARIESGLAEPVLEVGNLTVSRDFCDVRDIAEAYGMAAEGRVAAGTYNLASGKATPLEHIVELLRELARRPFTVRARKDLIREGERPSFFGSAERFRNATGWCPKVPIETSVRDALEWWRSRIHE
jgi:GDP-4-dehydro-6-deoxy-D-mannose reductase